LGVVFLRTMTNEIKITPFHAAITQFKKKAVEVTPERNASKN